VAADAAVVGFELVEDERVGFIGGADDLAGTTEARRAGAAAGAAAGLVEDIAGLDATEPLVDFFRGAAAGLAAADADAEDGAGLEEVDLPAPKVPALSIYRMQR
jgi:hypothetical protein